MRSARFFPCAWCCQSVVLCSHCDHGQTYCSTQCSKKSRRQKKREWAKKYATTQAGKKANARRQAHYRARHKIKVTRQSSKEDLQHDLLMHRSKQNAEQGPVLAIRDFMSALPICHRCKCECDELLRQDFMAYHDK